MLHFRVAILLSLCAGSLATHPTISVSDRMTTTESTSTSAQGSTSTTASTTTTESTSTSAQESTSSAASTTTTASASSLSATPDLKRLFGDDNRPNITHLGVVKADPDHSTDEAQTILRSAATLLFGLTKCNDKGDWIKSMFDLPEADNVVDHGAASAQVVLYGVDGENNWNRFTKKIDRYNMEKLSSFDIDTTVDDPWWPWALIEGALEAGWEPSRNNDRLSDLMKILIGEESILDVIDTSDKSNAIWTNVFSRADVSPLLILQGSEFPYWSVVMSAPYEKDGHKYLKWARPYEDGKGDSHGEFDDSFRGENRLITSVLHLEDLSPFNGRAATLNE